MKDRIKKLLIGGLKASEVASVLGCTPSYVAQCLADPDFKASVEAGMIEAAQEPDEEVHLDKRYTTLTHKILNNINDSLANADLPQLVRALEVVDKVQDNAKKRKLPLQAQAGTVNNLHITNISLPAHALAAPAPVVTVNEKNEIISIDAKPLAPMSADGVKNIFSQLAAARQVASEAKVIAEL